MITYLHSMNKMFSHDPKPMREGKSRDLETVSHEFDKKQGKTQIKTEFTYYNILSVIILSRNS